MKAHGPPFQPAKPILRWAGSKRKILSELGAYWTPDYERYVEPFVGSAQLFHHISPPKAILSDINYELISVYKALKTNPRSVFTELQNLPLGKRNYYKIRARNPREFSQHQNAARFIYLNRFCFNGLYRTNLNGEFNVPYAGYKTGRLPSLEELMQVSFSLKNVKLVNEDFEKVVIANIQKKDFVYLDPPYALKNTRIFNQYDPNSFGLADIDRLVALLDFIEKKGATFLLSYAYDPSIKKMFSNWPTKRIFVQRNMAGFKKNARMASELLVTNCR